MPRHRDEDEDEDDRPRRRRARDEDDDEADLPRRPSRPRRDVDEPRPSGSNGLATASLVFGILSFCTGITFIPGLICGFMGLAKSKKAGTGKGVAIAGILTSFAGMFLSIAAGVGGYFLATFAERDRERMVTRNNFYQTSLATQNYESANGYMPKPYVKDTFQPNEPAPSESELKSMLSWRVSLLPFIEQGSTFQRFSRTEPWDSSTNKPLSQIAVKTYSDFDTPLDPTTRMRCFYGPGTVFELKQRVRITDILDGTSNTLMYVEGAEKVTWSQFNEYKFDPNGALPAMGHPKRDYFMVGMVDGSARPVKKTVSPSTFKAAITRSGGEVLGADW